ncbi:MAG: hypothetical protein WBM32_18225, partial [Crocosphaera sp.]
LGFVPLPGRSRGGLWLCGLGLRRRLTRLLGWLLRGLGSRSVPFVPLVAGGAFRFLLPCVRSRWLAVPSLVWLWLSDPCGGLVPRFLSCGWPVWLPFFLVVNLHHRNSISRSPLKKTTILTAIALSFSTLGIY